VNCLEGAGIHCSPC